MKNEIKVSVIIPVYNGGEYITCCIDSILEQTLKELEVIVIDDCSTDGTYEACRQRYEGNERVVLLQQRVNSGPGAARNAGIENARGEYIGFVDADDGVVKEAYEDMYRVAKDTDADVVHVSGMLVPFERKLRKDLSSLPDDMLIKIENEFCETEDIWHAPKDIKKRTDQWLLHYYHWTVWNKLYRRSFLNENGLRFEDISLAEDQLFIFRCLIHADNYVKMPAFYNIYRIEAESLSRGRLSAEFLRKLLKAFFALPGYLDEAMDKSEFFADNREYRDKVKGFFLGCLEKGFMDRCYKAMKRQAVEEDEIIRGIFEEHFGSNAFAVEKMFCDLYDSLPEIDYGVENMNSYEFWEGLVERFGRGNIIRTAE